MKTCLVLLSYFSFLCCRLYSQAPDTWIIKTNFPYQAFLHTAGFAINDKAYILNGANGASLGIFNYMYDPVLNSWTQKASIPITNASKLHGLTIGSYGYAGVGNYPGSSTQWYQYNSISNSWAAKAAFPGASRGDGACFSIGNKGYLVGGNIGSNQVWEYDASADIWLQKNNAPWNRYDASWFVINQKAYVMAGRLNGVASNDCWEYDPISDTWTAKANIPAGTYYAGIGFAIGTKGYFGFGDTGINNFYEYDPLTNTWTSRNNNGAPALGFYFHCTPSLTLNGKGYTGISKGSVFSPQNNWYEYTPLQNPLPIELTKFSAKQLFNNVIITWQTASEINNNYFSLEHSEDGITFYEIMQIKGAGNSSAYNNYFFTHENVKSGRHFYRLKQVDFNNYVTYSTIEYVTVETNATTITAWFSNNDNLFHLDGIENITPIKITFYTVKSQVVFSKTFSAATGFSFDVASYLNKSEIYLYSVLCRGKSYAGKIAVINN